MIIMIEAQKRVELWPSLNLTSFCIPTNRSLNETAACRTLTILRVFTIWHIEQEIIVVQHRGLPVRVILNAEIAQRTKLL